MELWLEIQQYFTENKKEYFTCLGEHISISLIAFFIACAVGMLCAAVCMKKRAAAKYMTGLFQVLRIIPSLTVLVLLIPVMGVGEKPAVAALVLLAVPPVLMNTVAGFLEAPEFIIETAKGLGMAKRQIFWKVRLPLACPMILTGMRTALVEIIASAAIAAKIGAGGLGGIILTGLSLNRADLLLIGGVSVAALSLLSGLAFYQAERFLLRYRHL